MVDLEFGELCAHIEDEMGAANGAAGNGGGMTAALTRNYK